MISEILGEILAALFEGRSKGPLTSRKAKTCDECGGGHYHHPRCSIRYPGAGKGRS